jgi:uncharacterized DUF497 family protein
VQVVISVEDARETYGEIRIKSLGKMQGRVIFLAWTPRGDDAAHLISCRYADRKQTDDFFSAL